MLENAMVVHMATVALEPLTTVLKKKINAKMFENKILCGSTATTLRILPPLIITKANVDAFIKVLDNVTKEFADEN